MTIKIKNASVINNAHGIHTNGNSKPVFCKTTGEFFASLSDAAHSVKGSVGTMSCALKHRNGVYKGMKWCYVSDIEAHIDDIATDIRDKNAMLADYDAMKAKWEQIERAKDECNRHKENVAELERKIEDELALLRAAEDHLNALIYGND